MLRGLLSYFAGMLIDVVGMLIWKDDNDQAAPWWLGDKNYR